MKFFSQYWIPQYCTILHFTSDRGKIWSFSNHHEIPNCTASGRASTPSWWLSFHLDDISCTFAGVSPDGDQTSYHQMVRPSRPLTTSTVSGFCHLFHPRSSASTIFRPSHSFTSNSPIYRQPPLDRPVYLTISDSQVAPLDQFWLLEQSTYSYSCLNSCSYSPFTPHTCNISPASPSCSS